MVARLRASQEYRTRLIKEPPLGVLDEIESQGRLIVRPIATGHELC
jgi:hypothetical protein